MTKQCTKCGETKPKEMFFKHPDSCDGRVHKCKVCVNDDRRNREATKVKRLAESQEIRLCRRPQRLPGVAPQCDDDKEDHRKNVVTSAVSLPRLKCLEAVR